MPALMPMHCEMAMWKEVKTAREPVLQWFKSQAASFRLIKGFTRFPRLCDNISNSRKYGSFRLCGIYHTRFRLVGSPKSHGSAVEEQCTHDH
jgi:hypothetical protein